MKVLLLVICLTLTSAIAGAAEMSGVFIDDQINTENGETLLLNGTGLREKFWVDVYVGSLYLAAKSGDVAEILSKPGPLRIQLDFVYKEVAADKLLESWREGFENNQDTEALLALKDRIEQFSGYFDNSAVARDRYRFDYQPGAGTSIRKNETLLGVIPGEDFRNALVEIWLGNQPADKDLKKAMLGL